jgi:histone deacetylase complex regulatory component SIN3
LPQLSLPPPPGPSNVAPGNLPREPVATTMAQTETRALMPSMSHAPQIAPQIAPIRAVGSGQAPPGEPLPPMVGGNVVNGIVAPLPAAPGGAVERRGPVEFNHAISYVNKIKNRFAQQPDIYKQFLEILQTYQRESRPIGDVYSQVTRLFETAPDLLEDFKQFLPESAAHANAVMRARDEQFAMSNVRGDAGYPTAPQPANQTPRPEQPRLPPIGNFTPTPSSSKENKRKRGAGQNAAAASTAADHPGPRAQYAPGPHINKVRSCQLYYYVIIYLCICFLLPLQLIRIYLAGGRSSLDSRDLEGL